MKNLELLIKILKIFIDFLFSLLGFVLAYEVRAVTDLIPGVQLPINLYTFPDFGEYLLRGVFFSIVLVIIFAVLGEYSIRTNEHFFFNELVKISVGCFIWISSLVFYYFLIRDFPFSRLALIFTWIFSWSLIVLGRIGIKILVRLIGEKEKILILGKGELVGQIISFYVNKFKFVIVENLDEIENKVNLSEIGFIIDVDGSRNALEKKFLYEFCREKHLDLAFVPDALELQKVNVELIELSGVPMIKFKRTTLEGWGKVVKRLVDLVGAILGILILSPIMLFVALLIKFDGTGGPVLFSYLDDGTRAKRVGQKGKLFNFYKFRTMIPNAHAKRYGELLKNNIRGTKWDENSPLIKIKNDPRITKVGRFLRRFSIDELPQLFNVLMGDMSLVGPRAHLPEEVEKYKKNHRFLLTVKPGITGLAAINGRSDLKFEEEVRLETYYIENWSIWLDFKIIIKTFFVLFKRFEE